MSKTVSGILFNCSDDNKAGNTPVTTIIGHHSRPLLRLLVRANREPSTLHMTSAAGANQINDLVDGR
jgi:hypothetical protein